MKDFYYLYATSLNSDTITKATDQIEYEVEDTQTTTNTYTTVSGSAPDNGPGGKGGSGGMSYHTNTNTTTVITKSKEIFQNSRNLTGDFQINGYSSYDAMTEFVNGTYQITEGSIMSSLDNFECVINSELATLNEITVGNTITLKNPNTETTYDFVVTGIYLDNSNTEDTSNMYSATANTIITGSKVVEQLVLEDESLVTNVTPTFILTGEDAIDGFTEEVKEKGLGDYYTVTTNLDDIKNATKSIENVATFATTFLIITLIFQSYNLLPHLTAIENIIMSMDVSKVKVKHKKEKALELMESVGLTKEHAKRKILKLSGGEQQRIAIARSLSYNPKIIVADEPTGNLDKDTENEILNIFKKLAHDENKCVIIVTHSQNICDNADVVFELKKD